MSVNVNDKIKKLNPVQRRKIEERAAELIAEETIRQTAINDLISYNERFARRLQEKLITKGSAPTKAA